MKKIGSIVILLLVNVFANAQCTDLIISEYVEGTNNNKAIEIYNPTANNISLAGNYRLVRYSNGTTAAVAEADAQYSISLGSHTITSYSTFVYIVDKRDPSGTGNEIPIATALETKGNELAALTPARAAYICPDYNTSKVMYQNGNDALAIQKWNGSAYVYVDIFAVIGECPIGYSSEAAMTLGSCNTPTAGWSNLAPFAEPPATYNTAAPPTGDGFYFKRIWTTDHTLTRKSSVKQGVTANPALKSWNVATQWDSLPANTFSDLGAHTCDCYVPATGTNEANLATLTTPTGSFVTSFTSPSYTTSNYVQTAATISSTFTYYVYLPYTTSYPVNLPTLNYSLVNTSSPASLTTYIAGASLVNSTSVSTTTIKVKSTNGAVINTYRILFKVAPLITSNEANLATLTTPTGSFVTSFTTPNYTTSNYVQTATTVSSVFTYYIYLPYTPSYPVNLPVLNYTLVNSSAPTSLTTYSNGTSLTSSTSISTVTITVKSTDGTVINKYNVLFKVEPEIQVVPNGTPVLLSATASSVMPNYVSITWSDNSTNESNFLVIRNSTVIATLTENVTSYIDNSVAFSTPYTYQVKASNSLGTSATSNSLSVVTMQEPTAINELGIIGLKIYPNPAESNFIISFDNVFNNTFMYKIIDLSGREVLSNKTNAISGLNIYPVDVTSIAKGLYFVECVVGDKKVTNKIVVE